MNSYKLSTDGEKYLRKFLTLLMDLDFVELYAASGIYAKYMSPYYHG